MGVCTASDRWFCIKSRWFSGVKTRFGHSSKDGSWLYCATQSQISNDVLNGIKYPHIPSAPERRAAQANEAQAEEPEQVCEEVEEETEEERAQFAAAGDDAESDAFGDY